MNFDIDIEEDELDLALKFLIAQGRVKAEKDADGEWVYSLVQN